MFAFVALPFALYFAWLWLCGSVPAAVLLLLAYIGIGGGLALQDSPDSFFIVCGLIAAPYVVRSLRAVPAPPAPEQHRGIRIEPQMRIPASLR